MRSFALAFPALVTAHLAYTPAEASGALQNILKNTDKTDKYRYPTDFTRDIEPVSCCRENSGLYKIFTPRQKPFHSHNDYWRDVPFYSGLAAGAISTEADVWLIDGTLYVGLCMFLAIHVLVYLWKYRELLHILSINSVRRESRVLILSTK